MPFDALIARARKNPKHIVLGEGCDERIIEGAVRAAQDGIAKITLIGKPAQLEPKINKHTSGDHGISIIDQHNCNHHDEFAGKFHDLRKHKGICLDDAKAEMRKPLPFTAMMVRNGLADGSINGAMHTTAATVRAALQIIGVAERYSLVSSFFIMVMNEPHHNPKGIMIFSDCGMVIDPDAEGLAQIALAASDNAKELMGLTPRVAMLSFSTKGSASHPQVDKVANATALVKKARPGLIIDGELQLDAAIVPSVNKRKAPGSPVEGTANVLIFPSLEAGNIGYKLAQRIGGAKAIGPVLQGLKQPANDLSRGCNADDVYRMIAVTCVQAQTA